MRTLPDQNGHEEQVDMNNSEISVVVSTDERIAINNMQGTEDGEWNSFNKKDITNNYYFIKTKITTSWNQGLWKRPSLRTGTRKKSSTRS